ncbi:MAG: nucleoside recognition domain-containing protein, partial [Desulfosalsimonadaceae bacterium]|nr:nucleoside recognition domain-containing protein [Desulfosalsimonadaceae bacterium]
RLPVYIVLAGTFFAAHAGTVIFCIYLFGIVVAIVTGRLFRTALLRGEDAPFVMELPPYRVPMMKNLMIHMWDRSRMFLKKMGGIILIGSIVIWALSNFPRYDAPKALTPEMAVQNAALQAENSYIGKVGKTIEPFFAPIGIDWRGSVALLTGFVAKEIVVSTMGVLYAAEGDDDSDALRNALRNSGMTPLSALSMMIFVLLYVPCLATIGAITRETGSVKWTLFNIAFTTGVAWTMSFVVYQGGRLLGF